jgi:membrane-associated protease RseP (regulator of RpoE activity)
MTHAIKPIGAAETEANRRPAGPVTPEEQRAALVRLLIVFAALVFATVATRTTKTVLVVVAFFVMIMLHEFGHFVAARLGGMKVTEFFVGFGPRLWSVRKGDTEYGVKALPLGGYVKIIGMHNLDPVADPEDEPRTYRSRPFPQRLAVAVAGSMMHFLIAFLLFFTVNAFVGVPTSQLEVGELSKLETGPSPAQEAGFALGDKILAVDGHRFSRWQDLVSYIQSQPGRPIQFVVQRGTEQIELMPTPVDLSTVKVKGSPASDKPVGFIGIGPKIVNVKVDPVTAVGRSADQFIGGDYRGVDDVAPGLIDNARALAGVFSPSGLTSYWHTVTGKEQPGRPDGGTRFLSPVGFVQIAGQAAHNGLFDVIGLLISINLFVGLFNLMPLLPLDGGHVAIAVYEAIRSRLAGRRYSADVAKLLPITYLVVLGLVFLGASALYLDIVRPMKFN